MTTLTSQLAPLEAPLQAGALGSAEVVDGFDSCWRTIGNVHENRGANREQEEVETRLEELKARMLALDARQGLLERLAKVDGAKCLDDDGGEALRILEKHEKNSALNLSALETKHKAVLAAIAERSQGVCDGINEYERKRAELSGLLDELRREEKEKVEKEQAGDTLNDLLQLDCKELETALEQETADIRQAFEEESRLKDVCASLEQQRDKLATTLSELKDQEEQSFDAKQSPVEEKGQEIAMLRERIRKVSDLTSIVEELSGAAVSELQDSSFVVTLIEEGLAVRLHFDPTSFTLTNAVILKRRAFASGVDKQLRAHIESVRERLEQAITKRAIDNNDCCMLVRELYERCVSERRLEEEIQSLRNTFPALSVSKNSGEVSVNMTESIMATFSLGKEYPRPYSPAKLTGLDAWNGWSERLLIETKATIEQIQAERPKEFCTMTQLLDALKKHFEALAREQSS